MPYDNSTALLISFQDCPMFQVAKLAKLTIISAYF